MVAKWYQMCGESEPKKEGLLSIIISTIRGRPEVLHKNRLT